MNIYEEIGRHEFQHVNAGEIVQRILKSREMYEARQRMKGVKAVVEEAIQTKEQMNRAEAEMEQRRKRQIHEESLMQILNPIDRAACPNALRDSDADGITDTDSMWSSPKDLP